MKHLLKIKLVAIFLLTGIILNAQDIQRFLGSYSQECVCFDVIADNSKHFFNIFFVVKEGIESDLLVDVNSFAMPRDFKAFILNDTSFIIPLQWQDDFRGGQASFSGEGKIRNDSLFLYYSEGGWFTVFDCFPKTDYVNTMFLSEANPNKVYYNAINQKIIIDDALQNQSLTLELVDMLGKVVLREINVCNSINIAHLPPGVYVYRLLQDNQVICRGKVLK
jgi:hypothetical protein